MAADPATAEDAPVRAASQSGAYLAVAAGGSHTCAIATDGTLTCWGRAADGQLDAPTGTFTSIDAGARYSCALGTDGAIACWGEVFSGPIGAGPGGTFTSLVAGGNHACAIGTDDSIACWGYNAWGQINSPDGTFVALALGWEHSCALATDGSLSCWGYHFGVPSQPVAGTYKALTSGAVHFCAIKDDDTMVCAGERNALNRGATAAPAGTFKAVSAGRHHNCAIKMDDTITCWGVNTSGQTDAPAGTFKAVSARQNHTCAMRMDDTITCWGSSSSRQSEAPAGTFTSMDLGQLHTCAVRTGGAIVCWGGQQFFGQTEEIQGGYRAIQSGTWHTCAIATDDTIVCWGSNDQGQLDAPSGAFSTLSVGGEHACALGFDGAVTCWGYNAFGQASAPPGTYTAVRAGDFHTCAIRASGTIACWGRSAEGNTNAPAGTFTALASGYFHTCAIRDDDTVACWGRNGDGQSDAPAGTYKALSLGDAYSCAIAGDDTIACWGTNADGESRAPTGSYTALTAGRHHTCAIGTDDAVTCWGRSRSGQSDAPAGAFRSLALGEFSACGLKSDGNVACWGSNSNGQSDPPDGTFTALSAGPQHSCGIRSDRSVACWPRLPEGVTWSTADATTVHDRPDVTVMFDAATYAVSEGGSMRVTLRLSADPERTVVIPLTTTNQGGAGSDDYAGVPATVALRGVTEQAFSLAATPDSVSDDGESVLIGLGALPVGVSLGAPTQTRVDIIDATRTVSFEQASYTVGEGGSVTVRLTLDSAAVARVDIPLTVTNQGGATGADYATPPANITIDGGDSEGSFTFSAVDDSAVERGESVRLGLGGLPAGYREGSTTETVVAITDDDVAQVAVSFGSAAYSVAEGALESITVNLSADPQRTVTIPLSRTNQGGASGSDYSLPFGVTFTSGQTTRTVAFSATQDSFDDDDESVRLGFATLPAGVSAGTPAQTVVGIVDDDHPEVTVGFERTAYTVPEGDGETIAVVLDRDPERRVEITLTVTPVEAARADFDVEWPDPGNPRRLVFGEGVTRQTFTFTSLADDEDEDAETVAFSIDTPSADRVTRGPARGATVTPSPDRVTLGPAGEATVTIDARPSIPVGGGGGGGGGLGGGGPSGPTPSEADFEWNIDRDIDELDPGNDWATGMWSDGATLWLLDNAPGAGDAVYAYDLETGERLEDREFDLDERNRAPRGIWSDGRGVAWVSDSGQETLFAYDLETGERLPERDIELARRNRDARGIWSDGETVWVADGGRDSLFAYELETGTFLAEYSLHDANGDPRGAWSDGVTLWVSDHGAKRLFAYRLPALPEDGPPDEPAALARVQGEEFAQPGRVGNNSPRGIWSDGSVMYVADANDDHVYSYNMPGAWDARLATLQLSGVDFGEFSPLRRDYRSETIPDGDVATLTAAPAREGASVGIDPPDHDGDPGNGRQVLLLPGLEITITVTSPDGSRQRLYRILLGGEEPGTGASCLRGAVDVGLSLVIYGGGSVTDLEACSERRHVTALYALHEGEYLPYVIGAPDIVNARFRALFAGGLPPLHPLIVRSEGPATPAPAAPGVTEPFATCLRGDVARGFSLVLHEGGSVAELVACAEELGVTALYALAGGEWAPYIIGAPDFVNRSFRELFSAGVPAATPLVVRSNGPSGGDAGSN